MSDFAEQAWDEGFSDENEYLEHLIDESVKDIANSQDYEPHLIDYIRFSGDTIKGVKRVGEKYRFIDSSDNIIDEFDYIGACDDRYVKIRNYGRWGFYDSHICQASELIYDEVGDLLFEKRIIESPEYIFENALLPVMKDGLWGFLDVSLKQIIPCEYQDYLNIIFLPYSIEKDKIIHDERGQEYYSDDVPNICVPLF